MTAGEGHNSTLNQSAQGQIKSIVERIERLNVEKAEVAEQIKEVFSEAKGVGFDVKVLRKVIARRRVDRAKQAEEDAILDLYLSALGDLPLFAGMAAEDHLVASITLTTGAGKSVTGTPDEVRSALSSVRSDDELYDEAVALVRREGKAGTSFIQRKLQLGYNRAASLVERMEAEHVISAADHAGARKVLLASTQAGG